MAMTEFEKKLLAEVNAINENTLNAIKTSGEVWK